MILETWTNRWRPLRTWGAGEHRPWHPGHIDGVWQITENDVYSRLAQLLEELCSEPPPSASLRRRFKSLPKAGPLTSSDLRNIDGPLHSYSDLHHLIADGASSMPLGTAYDALLRLRKSGAVNIIERPGLALLHFADLVQPNKERVRQLVTSNLLQPIIEGPLAILTFVESTLHRVSFSNDHGEQSITAAIVRLPIDGSSSYLVTCAHGTGADCTDHALAEDNDQLDGDVKWSNGRPLTPPLLLALIPLQS